MDSAECAADTNNNDITAAAFLHFSSARHTR
jgi:hypothetical protein